MMKMLVVTIITVGLAANSLATAQRGERLLYKGVTNRGTFTLGASKDKTTSNWTRVCCP